MAPDLETGVVPEAGVRIEPGDHVHGPVTANIGGVTKTAKREVGARTAAKGVEVETGIAVVRAGNVVIDVQDHDHETVEVSSEGHLQGLVWPPVAAAAVAAAAEEFLLADLVLGNLLPRKNHHLNPT